VGQLCTYFAKTRWISHKNDVGEDGKGTVIKHGKNGGNKDKYTRICRKEK